MDIMQKPSLAWIRQLETTVGEEATGVATDGFGNIFVTGLTAAEIDSEDEDGNRHGWLAKFDEQGRRLWLVKVNTKDWIEVKTIATDQAGNVFIGGKCWGGLTSEEEGGEWDAWIAKYDSKGNRTWLRQFGTKAWEETCAITVDYDGFIFAAGWTQGEMAPGQKIGPQDVWLAKYNQEGAQIWIRHMGSTEFDTVTGITVDPLNNICLTGATWGTMAGGAHNGGEDVWLAKLDSDGDQFWMRQLGTMAWEEAKGIATDHEGNIVVTGWTAGEMVVGGKKGLRDVWLAKFDPHGHQLWITQIGSTAEQESRSIATDNAGNIYAAGWTWGEMDKGKLTLGEDAWLARFDPAGNQIWLVQFGADRTRQEALGVATDQEGNIFISGWTTGNMKPVPQKTEKHAWVAKFVNH
jgi:hypothetical protein